MTDYNSSYTGTQIDNAVGAGLAVRGVTGIVKSGGDGTVTAAVVGQDYQEPIGGISSGSVVTFYRVTGGTPINSLTVNIPPARSGSGDPSPTNNRPFVGYTGVTIYQSGADTSDPDTLAISWQSSAGTIYDGELDVTTGLLTLTHAVLTLDGATDGKKITYQGSGSVLNFYLSLADGDPIRSSSGWLTTSELEEAGLICSVLTTQQVASGVAPPCISAYRSSAGNLQPRLCFTSDNTYGINSIETCNTWLANMYSNGTPVAFRYKLRAANIQTYQLTANELDALAGENNIWASAGTVKVDYFDPTIKAYIDSTVLGAIEGSY